MNKQHSPDTILERALELPDLERRLAWLEEACGNDEVLRADIDSLLAAAFAADAGFMDTLVDPRGQGPFSGSDADFLPSLEELQGDFPELEIIELIGRGGMGAVMKARQESLDRFVALKVLPVEWNESASFRERFEREAKTLAALNHPNIVTIHDFGERSGRFFFTMEYVDGTDLARMIHGGGITSELALALIPQICEAMQFAHDRGVVHRDIKPANILVTRNGRVKVADFGIAKLRKSPAKPDDTGVPDSTSMDLTAPRGVLGTPRYMAPEQAAGSGEIDHRADLYALGMVFYEMLVGSPPPAGTTPIQPSLKAKIDRRWDRVVMRALEMNPDHRYQNASEMKSAVEQVVARQNRLIPRWFSITIAAAVTAAAFILWPEKTPGEDGPLVNSLGMEFVPVPGVPGLVSVWETRVKDYATFTRETGRVWTAPPFAQTPEHPAVQVSWHDARAFCEWLTERERQAGRLKKEERYRLPTDLEWSAMAHLANEDGTDPKERHLGQLTVFPWGEEPPVPAGAGNFPDATSRLGLGSAAVSGYEDGFAATAPVGSFRPTPAGLRDLGGNVWEWTETPFSPDDERPALRGGGWWASEADDGWQSLLASHRRADVEATDTGAWDVGFRLIRGPAAAETQEADLFHLILDEDLEGVRSALKGGADPDAPNRAGQPLIVVAADSGNLAMMKLLREYGAKLGRSDRRGRTVLHAAAELGQTEMTDWLLHEGANSKARTIAGQEPFLLATARAPIALLEQLLAAGGPEVLTQSDALGMTPLDQACLAGPDETVRWIIGQLSSEQIRNLPESTVSTSTMNLTRRDSSLMTAFLSKAAGSLKSGSLGMALLAAVNYGQEANFALLFEAAGEDGLEDDVLHGLRITATGRGRPWAIKALLEKGWDAKAEGLQQKGGPMHWAVIPLSTIRQSTWSIVENTRGGRIEGWARRLIERQQSMMPPPATRETIRLLAEAGADLEARRNGGGTPLGAAAFGGNAVAVEALLDLGADIEAKDDAGFTPLLSAVEQGHLEIVAELDRRGANFEVVNNDGQTAHHLVGHHGEILRLLLSRNLPLETKDKEGATPLIYLAAEGDAEGVDLLLAAGADVNAAMLMAGVVGDTALHRACRLQGEGPRRVQSPNAVLGEREEEKVTPAERDERLRTIQSLLEAGADPMARTENLETPLHFAARSGLWEAVELFLGRGASPNAITKFLEGPLHFAATAGQLETVQVLVAHGAALDLPTFRTPLATCAVLGDNPAVLLFLVKNKVPVDRADLRGALPLHYASFEGRPKMAEILLDAGADPNARDFRYRTPAHIAAGRNHHEIIDLLWKRGARLKARDSANATPAQLAAQAGYTALASRIDSLAAQPIRQNTTKNAKLAQEDE